MHTPPSDAVIFERAKSLCNEACFTVALQHRRLRTAEPEDRVFVFRWNADLQFLIVALRRLRRGVELASIVPDVSAGLKTALEEFDRNLPNLSKMRNVGEHIDDYVMGNQRNRHKDVQRSALQVSTWNGTVFRWLGAELDIDIALTAAESLFMALAKTVKEYARVSG